MIAADPGEGKQLLLGNAIDEAFCLHYTALAFRGALSSIQRNQGNGSVAEGFRADAEPGTDEGFQKSRGSCMQRN